MYSMPPPAFRDDLAARLALKTGASKEQSRRFLDALAELIVEEEKNAPLNIILEACGYQSGADTPSKTPLPSLPAKIISFPLIEEEKGSVILDPSVDS
jgi:hypothetical protein